MRIPTSKCIPQNTSKEEAPRSKATAVCIEAMLLIMTCSSLLRGSRRWRPSSSRSRSCTVGVSLHANLLTHTCGLFRPSSVRLLLQIQHGLWEDANTVCNNSTASYKNMQQTAQHHIRERVDPLLCYCCSWKVDAKSNRLCSRARSVRVVPRASGHVP